MEYDGNASDEEVARRYFAEIEYRIAKAHMEHAQIRHAYLEQIYPNTLPTRKAVKEGLSVAGVTLGMIVLPIFGLMWLDQPDGLNSAGGLWLVYLVWLIVVALIQGGRVHQANKDHLAVIRATWARLNADGWPPLTDVEEAAHRDTTPQRLLQLAHSTDPDVLTCLGENPNLPPSGLEILARHPEPVVRLRAAWSPRTPASVLQALQADPDERVKEAAKKTQRPT